MTARAILAAAVFIATVGVAFGQMTTADGVAALARGDHKRAVEILKPIAEDWQLDDTAAQFFMAGLYETGRGVPADPMRACALYQRASSKHGHPFGQAAFPLFATLSSRGGREFDHECQFLANVGFGHGFEPVAFNLGPGHLVEWTLTAATVTYEGRTKRHELGVEIPGARFLPLRHTELRTGPMRSDTRHFIEMSCGCRGPSWASGNCDGTCLRSSVTRSSPSTSETRSLPSPGMRRHRATPSMCAST
jgi:hypothetical protein